MADWELGSSSEGLLRGKRELFSGVVIGMFIILIVLMIFTRVFICQNLSNCTLFVDFAFNYTSILYSIKPFLNIWGKKIFLPTFLNQVWRNLNFKLVGYEPLIVVSFIRRMHFLRDQTWLLSQTVLRGCPRNP